MRGGNPDEDLDLLKFAKPDHRRPYLQSVKDALAAGGNVNAVNEYGGFTVLMIASENDHPEVLAVVSALLAAGAKVDAADNGGWTTLFHASYSNYPETVHILAAAGADVNAADENGHTALMEAINNGDPEIVKAFIAEGADVNAVDKEGKTPMWWAVKAHKTSNTSIIKALSDAGAKKNFLNELEAIPPRKGDVGSAAYEAAKARFEKRRGGRRFTRKQCKKFTCKKMGFTQKASCRPYKNCYRSTARVHKKRRTHKRHSSK